MLLLRPYVFWSIECRLNAWQSDWLSQRSEPGNRDMGRGIILELRVNQSYFQVQNYINCLQLWVNGSAAAVRLMGIYVGREVDEDTLVCWGHQKVCHLFIARALKSPHMSGIRTCKRFLMQYSSAIIIILNRSSSTVQAAAFHHRLMQSHKVTHLQIESGGGL